MKKNVSSQSMDATLQDFLGNKPSMETPKPEPQPADTKEQPEKASEVVQEKLSEAVPEQTDETPQVVRRISGKQRRASLEEYKEAFLTVPTIEDRKPVFLSPQYARCPRPYRTHVRRAADERVWTGGEHRPAAPCHLRGGHRGMA